MISMNKRSPAERRLKKWSAETGRPLEDVSRHLGISRSTLTSWLAGQTEPKVSQAVAIEELTGGFVRLSHFVPKGRGAGAGG